MTVSTEATTMPLDIAPPRQQTTTAELHYLVRTAERPAFYVMEPPPGLPEWNGVDDPHTVLIEDARGREPEFTLDRSGFTLINAPTAVRNFYDPAEIKSVYYPEVERLLLRTLGASRVVVFDHNVRNGARKDLPQPSRRVHNDHTVNSAAAEGARSFGSGSRRATQTPIWYRKCLAADSRAGARLAARTL
jgi:hypothetical protein